MDSGGHPQGTDRGSGEAPGGRARAGQRTAERAHRPSRVEGAGSGPGAGHPGDPRCAPPRRTDAAHPPQLNAGQLLHPGGRADGRRRPDDPLHPVRRLDPPVAGDLHPRQRHEGDSGPPHLQQRPAPREDDDPLCRGEPTRRGRGGRGSRGGARPDVDPVPRPHPDRRRGLHPDVVREAGQPRGHRAAAPPLAVGAGAGRARQAGGAREGLCRAAALPAVQPGHRPHEWDDQ